MCNKVKNAGFCKLEILDLGLAQKCNATCGKCGKFCGQCINACIHNIQAMQKFHNVHLIMVAFIKQAQKNI